MHYSDEINTEIIATAGPTMQSVDDFVKAINAGATNFRIHLGLKHRDQHGYFANLRKAEKKLNRKVDVMVDFPTSRPRLDGIITKFVQVGEIIRFSDKKTDDIDILITNLSKFIKNVKVGERILFRDGKVSFIIKEVDVERVKLVAECNVSLVEIMKGGACVFPDSDITYETVTQEDIDLVLKMKNDGLIPDWIALSFVTDVSQIDTIKEVRERCWPNQKIGIISKIENKKGILNADKIIPASDGILIGRGDLALHVDPIKLPKIQSYLMAKARKYKKLSIIATEFLEGYATNGVIRRPELSDIALGVRQGASALMLAMESCNCERPIKCIELMRSIIREEMTVGLVI